MVWFVIIYIFSTLVEFVDFGHLLASTHSG